jgi:hypothetical protein
MIKSTPSSQKSKPVLPFLRRPMVHYYAVGASAAAEPD